MELDSGWVDYNTPSVNERSAEQVYRGEYSRKFVAAAGNDGIKSNTFTTVSGLVYPGYFYVYPPGTSIAYDVRAGDDSGFLVSLGIGGLTANTWNKVTLSATETAGGSSAYMVIRAVVAGTYYVDNVSIRNTHYGGAIRRCPSCKLIFSQDTRIYGDLCPKCKRLMPS